MSFLVIAVIIICVLLPIGAVGIMWSIKKVGV